MSREQIIWVTICVYAVFTAAVGYAGKILWDSSKPDGTMRKLTDVSRLHSLGWHHRMEIEDGVPALYKWYVDNL